jgi:hypothetical protein
MSNDIILSILEKELKKLIIKRDKLWNRQQANPYSEICQIRQGFKDIVDKYGITSQQASTYAIDNTKRERDLINEAEYINKNTERMLNEVVQLDRDINSLSNEIFRKKAMYGN